MDPELIAILAGLVFLAGWAYYRGFVSRKPSLFPWMAQAGFVALALVPIPFTLLTLAQQRQAVRKLEREGIVPHPAIANAVGVATGPGPISRLLPWDDRHGATWLFDTKASPEDVLAFYRNRAHTPGWTLVEDSPVLLIFRQGTRTLAISPRRGPSRQVVYMVTDGGEPRRSGRPAETP